MKIAVLGVGNVLLSDEGLGVRVVEEIRKRYSLPEEVLLIDGGTLGIDLLYFLEGVERLLVVDAVLGGLPPGSLYKFKGEEVLTYFKSRKLSAHVCLHVAKELAIERVCLSGGVMQNDPLVSKIKELLEAEGFKVYTHQRVPPNDGGLSLGQALFQPQEG